MKILKNYGLAQNKIGVLWAVQISLRHQQKMLVSAMLGKREVY